MTVMDSQPPDPTSNLIIRPSKRRKVYRQRDAGEDLEVPPEIHISSNPQQVDLDVAQVYPDELGTSITNILKTRKSAKARKKGIEFSNTVGSKQNPSAISNELESRDGTLEDIATIVNRFAPQTGQVADVDQHM